MWPSVYGSLVDCLYGLLRVVATFDGLVFSGSVNPSLTFAFQRARLSFSIVVSVKGTSFWLDSSLSRAFFSNFGSINDWQAGAYFCLVLRSLLADRII